MSRESGSGVLSHWHILTEEFASSQQQSAAVSSSQQQSAAVSSSQQQSDSSVLERRLRDRDCV